MKTDINEIKNQQQEIKTQQQEMKNQQQEMKEMLIKIFLKFEGIISTNQSCIS